VEAGFFECARCDSTLFPGLSRRELFRTVLCHYAPARAQASDLVPYLRRFLSRYGLWAPVEVRNFEGLYLPFWHIEKTQRTPTPLGRGAERAAFSLPYLGLQGYRPPRAGFERLLGQKRKESAMAWLAPTLALEAALSEWERRHGEPRHAEGESSENIRLLLAPVYTAEYEYEGAVYRTTMDGVTGRILPEEIPPSPALLLDRKTLTFGLGAGALFLVEGLLFPGLLLTLAAYAATGALLYPVAARMLLGSAR
jgi:hypothetical protein